MAKEQSEFWQGYRDPRWQEKRLRVMEAAGFKCAECADKSTTLNVHHRHYVKDRKPWEYENHELVCLCEPCHEARHDCETAIRRAIGMIDEADRKLLILGFIHANVIDAWGNGRVCVKDTFQLAGVCLAYGIKHQTNVECECDENGYVTHATLENLAAEEKEAVNRASEYSPLDELLVATTG